MNPETPLTDAADRLHAAVAAHHPATGDLAAADRVIDELCEHVAEHPSPQVDHASIGAIELERIATTGEPLKPSTGVMANMAEEALRTAITQLPTTAQDGPPTGRRGA